MEPLPEGPNDTLVIWKIDRHGRNLRDLIDIVTTLDERGVGVQSLAMSAERQSVLLHDTRLAW